MSGVFSKSILKVGTYHSPDQVIHVTPERLRHWEEQVTRLQSAGYAIPMHFDHSNEIALLEPIAMDVLGSKPNRSAEATVGKLESFKVSEDGQSAEITVHTLTPSATEKVAHNAVYVSPVIFPEWKDGTGQSYADVITSIDLVDHPVDSKQTSFVPAVRMALNSKPFKLSVQMADENDSVQDNNDPPANDSTQDNTPPVEDKTEQSSSNAKLSGILAALAKLNVILPADTDGDNFIDRLETGLLTAAAAQEPEEAVSDEEPVNTSSITEADPQIATMSLRIKQLEEDKVNTVREQKRAALDAALKEGRCTPAEHNKLVTQLAAIKMSVVPGKPVSAGDIDVWLASRASVPQGTFWTDKQRTESATKLSLAEAPESWKPAEGLTPKATEEAVDMLTRDIRPRRK